MCQNVAKIIQYIVDIKHNETTKNSIRRHCNIATRYPKVAINQINPNREMQLMKV